MDLFSIAFDVNTQFLNVVLVVVTSFSPLKNRAIPEEGLESKVLLSKMMDTLEKVTVLI